MKKNILFLVFASMLCVAMENDKAHGSFAKPLSKRHRKKNTTVRNVTAHGLPVSVEGNDTVDGFAELEQGLGLSGPEDEFGQTALSVYDAINNGEEDQQISLDSVKSWLSSVRKQHPEQYEKIKKTIVRGGKDNNSLIKTVLEVGFAIAGEIRDHNRESTRVGEEQLKEAQNARKVAEEALETQKNQARFYKRSTYLATAGGIVTTAVTAVITHYLSKMNDEELVEACKAMGFTAN